MKKISLPLTMALFLAVTIITLTGCEAKHCSISGCPSEAVGGFLYCTEHKCKNSKCENQNVGTFYTNPSKAVKEYWYCRTCLADAK